MRGISRKLIKLAGSEWIIKENIVIWIVVHRSSDGYYNYKNIAVIVTYPEDTSDMYEEDSRNVLTITIDTGMYQEFDEPSEVINAIKYIAKKYRLHCKIIRLDWYYHFVAPR